MPMPTSAIIALVVIFSYFALISVTLMIHGIWIAPFIERHGERTAGFTAFWFLGGFALIQDYLKAKRICKRMGFTPRWMKWIRVLLIIYGIFSVGILLWIIFAFLWAK